MRILSKSRVLLLAAALLIAPATGLAASKSKSKKKKSKTEQAEKPKVDKYTKMFVNDKSCQTARSPFLTLHKLKGKLYAEVPLETIGREMLIASTISEASDINLGTIGYKPKDPMHVKFTRIDPTLYLAEAVVPPFCDPRDSARLKAIGQEKGVTFDYADYYANAQADQTNLNQIGADLVADDVDVIVAVATPATMLAAVEDTDIPVVYSAVTDPAAAGFDTEPNITGTSDALNTDAIMNLILAVNPDIDTIGLLYDLSQDASTQAIADAKAFCDSKGIKYIEKNGTTTAEVQMAAEALIAAGVKAVFTPTDNTIMTAELSIYESFIEAGVQHYTGADSFALNGALVGYGVDYVQLGEATADMVSQLLCDGKTPADLPYQTFDNGIVTINTETAEALGLDLAALKEAFKPYCTEITEVTTAENFS